MMLIQLLTLAACIAVVWWGLVSLAREALDAHDDATACKHVDTAWSATPDGITVSCTACHSHVGTWQGVGQGSVTA